MSGAEKMKELCWKVRMKNKNESNNNDQQHAGDHPPPKRKRNRFKKRMTTLLHTHVALIILTVLTVLDATCVIGQIISDILIMKDELHEKEVIEAASKDLLFDTFPGILNRTLQDSWTIQAVIAEVQSNLHQHAHDHAHAHDHSHDHDHDHDHDVMGLHPHPPPIQMPETSWPDLFNDTHDPDDLTHPLSRRKRAGANHQHHFTNEATEHYHHMLHELTHAFHLGSMVILTLLVLVTLFKIFIMGKQFLHHKIEVFDAFVITVSWCLDVAFWEGLWAHPENEAANIMIFILPWRVIRIVNGFVLVIQGRDLLQLKIVKQQYRGSAKRANELKMKVELYRVEIRNLHSLCKKKGCSEKEIQQCAPSGGRRRRSSLLPVLTRLASLGGISVNSSTDLLKTSSNFVPEPPTPDSSDTEDEEATYHSVSRQSSASDYSLARTVSNMSSTSTVSTIMVSPRTSTASYGGEDNPVFIDEKIIELPDNVHEEDFYTKL